MSISWERCEKHKKNQDPNINGFGLKITERMRSLKPGDWLPTGDVNEIWCEECYANARAAFPAEPLKLGKSYEMMYDSEANNGEGGFVVLG